MVRNMGTLGGSVANSDPAADYPAALVGLGATVNTNKRKIAADQFFTGMFETALQPGEIITSRQLPGPEARGLHASSRTPPRATPSSACSSPTRAVACASR